MVDDSIKVAVRVRPFNDREKDLKSQCVVTMAGPQTILENPEKPDKPYKFTFDFSYWSHDPSDPHFANQSTVFEDLGKTVLQNAWDGYNTSLFAYGQTGSGKSYSMVGLPKDKGIVPRVCEEIFTQINGKNEEGMTYTVETSMMEIYNEMVRDLLNSKNPNNKSGLRVRENVKTGTYVEGLSSHIVHNYHEIDSLMGDGFKTRTIEATKMNQTSSRAHTLIEITFTQTMKKDGRISNKVSKMTLVDLAGSEKVAKTGATGDRMKEGIAINQSLSTLGDCISALADRSSGKNPTAFIPYRRSQLTWVLKNSLGGNSKTIMIAAISPARYADRAKKIKNRAIVNEDPQEKLIKELKEQIDLLKKQLEAGGGGAGGVAGLSDEEKQTIEQLTSELINSQEIIKNLELTVEEKEEQTKRMALARKSTLFNFHENFDRKVDPHFVNLNEDPQMSERLVYPLLYSSIEVGRDVSEQRGIVLGGLGIEDEHCVINSEKDGDKRTVSITPKNGKTYLNGKEIKETTILKNGDRVIVGVHHVFRYVNGKESDGSGGVIDFHKALSELAETIALEREQKVRIESEKRENELKEQINKIMEEKKLHEDILEEERKKLKTRDEELNLQKKKMQEAVIHMETKLKEKEEKLFEEIKLKEQEILNQADEQKKKEMEEKLQIEKEAIKQKLKEEKSEMKKREQVMVAALNQMSIEKKQLIEKHIEFEKKKLKQLQEQEEELKRQRSEQQKLADENELMKSKFQSHKNELSVLINMLSDANMISYQLDRDVDFELKIVSEDGNEKFEVKVRDERLHYNTVWSLDNFQERLSRMREIYEQYEICMSNEKEFKYQDHVKGAQDDPFFDIEGAKKFNIVYGQESKQEMMLQKKIEEIEKRERLKIEQEMQDELKKMSEREMKYQKELEMLMSDQNDLRQKIQNELEAEKQEAIKKAIQKEREQYVELQSKYDLMLKFKEEIVSQRDKLSEEVNELQKLRSSLSAENDLLRAEKEQLLQETTMQSSKVEELEMWRKRAEVYKKMLSTNGNEESQGDTPNAMKQVEGGVSIHRNSSIENGSGGLVYHLHQISSSESMTTTTTTTSQKGGSHHTSTASNHADEFQESMNHFNTEMGKTLFRLARLEEVILKEQKQREISEEKFMKAESDHNKQIQYTMILQNDLSDTKRVIEQSNRVALKLEQLLRKERQMRENHSAKRNICDMTVQTDPTKSKLCTIQ